MNRSQINNLLLQYYSQFGGVGEVYGIDHDTADLPANQANKRVILNTFVDTEGDSHRYLYVNSFKSMPVHEKIQGCVMDDVANQHIAYYLDPEDASYKYPGTYNGITTSHEASKLDGTDGEVLEEYYPFYIRVDHYDDYLTGHHHKVYFISPKSFKNAEVYPLFRCGPGGEDIFIYYVGKFRSVHCDSNGVPKTHANTTPASYSNGDKFRSIAGYQPAGNVSRPNFRKGHEAVGGTNVHFLFGPMIKLLMGIEFNNFDEQEALSPGFVFMKSYAYSQMRLTGRNISLGQRSAGIEAVDELSTDPDYDLVSQWSTSANTHAKRIVSVSYRGLENPWGSQWIIEDGIQKNQNGGLTSIFINNLWFEHDSEHDVTRTSYGWVNGSTYIYSVSDTPSVGDRTYTNTTFTTYKSTVTAVDSSNDTITVSGVVYNRASAKDTEATTYAWYNATNNVRIYTGTMSVASGNAYTDTTFNTTYTGSISRNIGDYTESGYWMTTDSAKYVTLDTDQGRVTSSSNTFPMRGTGNAIAWVPHAFPKYDHYISNFDDITFFPLPYEWWNSSQTKSLSDRAYNDAAAGVRGSFRGGASNSGLSGGCSAVYLAASVTSAAADYGSRLAVSKKLKVA